MTQFKVGDRVMVKKTGQEGIVRGFVGIVPDSVFVGLDSGVGTFYSSGEVAHVAVKTELVPFYQLLLDGMETCRKRHATLEEARTEAKRLLHLPHNHGKGITILQAVSYGRLLEGEVEWHSIP